MEGPLVDTRELANYLNVSEKTVRRLVAARAIPFYRIGGSIRFRPDEVAKWLENEARFEAAQKPTPMPTAGTKYGIAIAVVVLALAWWWLSGGAL